MRTTTVKKPIYKNGRLVGHEIITYRPVPRSPARPQPVTAATGQLVTLDTVMPMLKRALDEQDARFERKLAALSQQLAEQAEREQLTAHLYAYNWTPEECAGVGLVALRRLVQAYSPSEDNLPSAAPKGWD